MEVNDRQKSEKFGTSKESEYKHVVLSLFFLKLASDKFEEQRAKFIADGMEKFADNTAFYTKDSMNI